MGNPSAALGRITNSMDNRLKTGEMHVELANPSYVTDSDRAFEST
jgi:hypothetical protein